MARNQYLPLQGEGIDMDELTCVILTEVGTKILHGDGGGKGKKASNIDLPPTDPQTACDVGLRKPSANLR